MVKTDGPAVFFSRCRIELSGVISSQEDADDLITALKALRPLLKASRIADTDPSEDGNGQ